MTFEEAASAFDDELAIAAANEAHSRREERRILIGMSKRLRLVTVATPNAMKKSVSSLLAEARDLRKRVMPSKAVVHKVKFSPEEMAFEPLADYSHLKFERRKSLRNLVELDPDLVRFYKSSDAVNNALRKLMEALPAANGGRRKRSA